MATTSFLRHLTRRVGATGVLTSPRVPCGLRRAHSVSSGPRVPVASTGCSTSLTAARASVFAGRSGSLALALHTQRSRYAATLAAAGGVIAMAASSTVESEAATNPLLHPGDFPLFDQVPLAPLYQTRAHLSTCFTPVWLALRHEYRTFNNKWLPRPSSWSLPIPCARGV
eukprot:8643761-Pyramimonas_sp.AAC.1